MGHHLKDTINNRGRPHSITTICMILTVNLLRIPSITAAGDHKLQLLSLISMPTHNRCRETRLISICSKEARGNHSAGRIATPSSTKRNRSPISGSPSKLSSRWPRMRHQCQMASSSRAILRDEDQQLQVCQLGLHLSGNTAAHQAGPVVQIPYRHIPHLSDRV